MTPSATSIQSNFPVGPFVLLVLVYAYFAVALGAIAKKTGHGAIAWWGWVPVMQVLLILKVAGVAWWWIFLFLIPLVNIIVGIVVWVKVARVLSKHPIWGVLMVVPGVDIFVLGYLAFSK